MERVVVNVQDGSVSTVQISDAEANAISAAYKSLDAQKQRKIDAINEIRDEKFWSNVPYGSTAIQFRNIEDRTTIGDLGAKADRLVAANITAGSGTGAISGNVLTISNVISSTFAVGDVIEGVGVAPNTAIVALISGTGGNGTYAVNVAQELSSVAVTGHAGVPLILEDDTIAQIAASDFVTLSDSIMALKAGIRVYARTMKNNVLSAATETALNAIDINAGWPS